jgi:hypothetical protein
MEILIWLGVLALLVGSYVYTGYWVLLVLMRWIHEKGKDEC